jgi:genome maintenance exonuclease 1
MSKAKHNPIYEYAELKRRDTPEGRRYETPDGGLVASVTTILDKTKDKTHLIEWRKRVGEKKAQEITTEAAGRGTSMHKQLENWLEFGELKTGGNLVHQTAGTMAQKIIDEYMDDMDEWWGSEAKLYYPHLYAGTTDLTGVYRGKQSIIDFKQTNKPKKTEWIDDYFMQGAAYAIAHNHLFDTGIEQMVIMMCSPDLQPQRWIVSGAEFQEWQNRWWNRVEQYYSQS